MTNGVRITCYRDKDECKHYADGWCSMDYSLSRLMDRNIMRGAKMMEVQE